jgi:sugar O-acyltransferase (sialic acid O-acetyltransferase NeuD family)
MSEKLVVAGTGGLGREVMFLINEVNKETTIYDILGFIDGDDSNTGKMVDGFQVLGTDDWLLQCDEETNVVIAIGSGKIRSLVYEKLSVNKKLKFPSVLANNTVLPANITFGQGCIVLPSCVFSPNVAVGSFSVINPACTIAHDVIIADFATLSPGVNIAGNVNIKEYTNIGIGACVIQGIGIGCNTIIGAGAVVVSNIPDDCTAVGVPAKPIKFTK